MSYLIASLNLTTEGTAATGYLHQRRDASYLEVELVDEHEVYLKINGTPEAIARMGVALTQLAAGAQAELTKRPKRGAVYSGFVKLAELEATR